MRFVCLFHIDAEQLGRLTPEELARFDLDNRDADARLIESGHYVSALALSGQSATVRRRAGRVSLTDGPYAETKEQMAGFWIIEAPDFDAALEWAAKGSEACGQPVEVRAVHEV